MQKDFPVIQNKIPLELRSMVLIERASVLHVRDGVIGDEPVYTACDGA